MVIPSDASITCNQGLVSLTSNQLAIRLIEMGNSQPPRYKTATSRAERDQIDISTERPNFIPAARSGSLTSSASGGQGSLHILLVAAIQKIREPMGCQIFQPKMPQPIALRCRCCLLLDIMRASTDSARNFIANTELLPAIPKSEYLLLDA